MLRYFNVFYQNGEEVAGYSNVHPFPDMHVGAIVELDGKKYMICDKNYVFVQDKEHTVNYMVEEV